MQKINLLLLFFCFALWGCPDNPDPLTSKEYAEMRVHGRPAFAPVERIDYLDVSPNQIISIATSLIPFVEHDDARLAGQAHLFFNRRNRALENLRVDVFGFGRAEAHREQILLAARPARHCLNNRMRMILRPYRRHYQNVYLFIYIRYPAVFYMPYEFYKP